MPGIFIGPRIIYRGMKVITIAPSHYGIAIRMINGTGAASVKGTVVSVSPSTDGEFVLQNNEYDSVGVVAESRMADGSECFVTIQGVAEVLWKDGEAATRGNVAISADTDGRAIGVAVPSSNPVTAEHFKEIGHVIQSKDAGTNVLVRCILHFN